MLVFNGGGVGGGYFVGKWSGGDGKGGIKLTNVVLYARLEPYIKVQLYHTTLFQVI